MSSSRGKLFGKRISKKGTGQHLMSNADLLSLLKQQKMIKDVSAETETSDSKPKP